MAKEQYAPFFENWHDEFMPLTVAVEWIARHGGNVAIELNDANVWDEPIKEFLRAAQRGDITAWGNREGDSDRDPEPVPREMFAMKWLSPAPTDDAICDWALFRHIYPYIDFNYGDWPGGGADAISSHKKVLWSRIIVAKADVIRLWRFPAPRDARSEDHSEEDARAVIRAAIEKNGGFIGQNKGAKIVREKVPGFPVKRAMALVKEITGNEKPGPKGPRKNRAANRA